jgi:hypothetical protein
MSGISLIPLALSIILILITMILFGLGSEKGHGIDKLTLSTLLTYHSATFFFFIFLYIINADNVVSNNNNNNNNNSIHSSKHGVIIILLIVFGLVTYYHYYIEMEINNNIEKDDKKDKLSTKTQENVRLAVVAGLSLFFLILILCILFGIITGRKIFAVLLFFYGAVTMLGSASYVYERTLFYKESSFTTKISFIDFISKGKKEGQNFSKKTESEYIKPPINIIIPSLIFGLVFGFIDNAGLITGMDALDNPFSKFSELFYNLYYSKDKQSANIFDQKPKKFISYSKKYKNEDDPVMAGLGNTFSDGLGVTIGAFFGKLASTLFPSDIQQPLWIDMVGVIVGCLCGIMIPMAFSNVLAYRKTGNITAFGKIKDIFIIILTFFVIGGSIYYINELMKKQLDEENDD